MTNATLSAMGMNAIFGEQKDMQCLLTHLSSFPDDLNKAIADDGLSLIGLITLHTRYNTGLSCPLMLKIIHLLDRDICDEHLSLSIYLSVNQLQLYDLSNIQPNLSQLIAQHSP